MGDHLS